MVRPRRPAPGTDYRAVKCETRSRTKQESPGVLRNAPPLIWTTKKITWIKTKMVKRMAMRGGSCDRGHVTRPTGIGMERATILRPDIISYFAPH